MIASQHLTTREKHIITQTYYICEDIPPLIFRTALLLRCLRTGIQGSSMDFRRRVSPWRACDDRFLSFFPSLRISSLWISQTLIRVVFSTSMRALPPHSRVYVNDTIKLR